MDPIDLIPGVKASFIPTTSVSLFGTKEGPKKSFQEHLNDRVPKKVSVDGFTSSVKQTYTRPPKPVPAASAQHTGQMNPSKSIQQEQISNVLEHHEVTPSKQGMIGDGNISRDQDVPLTSLGCYILDTLGQMNSGLVSSPTSPPALNVSMSLPGSSGFSYPGAGVVSMAQQQPLPSAKPLNVDSARDMLQKLTHDSLDVAVGHRQTFQALQQAAMVKSLRLELDHHQFGRVTMDVQVDRHDTRVVFSSENMALRQAITQHADQLNRDLARLGLQLVDAQVRAVPPGMNQRFDHLSDEGESYEQSESLPDKYLESSLNEWKVGGHGNRLTTLEVVAARSRQYR